MRRRRLGRSGLLVSEIGLGGAWLLGPQGDLPLEHGVAVVRHALTLGVTLLDTSECYIGGRSERVYGAALAGYPGEVVLSTKCGHRPQGFDWSSPGAWWPAWRRAWPSWVSLGPTSSSCTPGCRTGCPWSGSSARAARWRACARRGTAACAGRWASPGRTWTSSRRCVESDAFDVLLLHDRFDLLEQSGGPLLREAAAHGMGVLLGSPLRVGLFGARRDAAIARYGPADRARIEALERTHAGEPGAVTGAAFRFALGPPEVSAVLCGAAAPGEVETAVRTTQAAEEAPSDA